MNFHHLLKLSRFEALTDGIFAIAMTILVLDIRLPKGLDETTLKLLLNSEIMHEVFIYMGSFAILGTQWIAMNFQQGFLDHINRPYLWANIFYLMTICIIPFSASLLAEYTRSYVSVMFYACNLIAANFGQWLTWKTSHHFKLNNETATTYARVVVSQRIYLAPVFYFASLIIAYWSIGLAFLALIAPPLIYIIPGRVDKVDQVGK